MTHSEYLDSLTDSDYWYFFEGPTDSDTHVAAVDSDYATPDRF